MNVKSMYGPGLLVLVLALAACERQVSFADDVQPILNHDCVECHGGTGEGAAASDFRVTDYASVMEGTRYGPVVVPGSRMSSALYLVIAGKTAPEIRMPPHHQESLASGRGSPLPEDQVETIGRWIDQGAADN